MTMALIACWRKLLVLCNLLRQKKSLAGGVNNLALNHQPSLKPCHSLKEETVNIVISIWLCPQSLDSKWWIATITLCSIFINDFPNPNTSQNLQEDMRLKNTRVWKFPLCYVSWMTFMTSTPTTIQKRKQDSTTLGFETLMGLELREFTFELDLGIIFWLELGTNFWMIAQQDSTISRFENLFALPISKRLCISVRSGHKILVGTRNKFQNDCWRPSCRR